MATIVFEGSSKDDIELAKQFWKAIDPISNVQSSLEHLNISQKLEAAPESKLNITYAHNPPQEDKLTNEHLERGRKKEAEEELKARKEVLKRRKKALDRLHRKIEERQQLEKQSLQSVIDVNSSPMNNDDLIKESDLNEINETMNALRHFEEDHNLIDEFNGDLSDY
ncbi:UPF0722 protein [Trichoplax sp. H2]|nr:UPF0722 protein [Trichoplax sp. H2]|eukprot:RDD46036.1 UPF0722 protein [Trichoplax sp. H2]